MDAKEYLSQARFLNSRIKSYELELEYYNNLALGPSGPNYEPDKIRQKPSLKAAFEIYFDKIMNLEKIIHDEIDKLLKLKEEITETIAKLNKPLSELVLRERYINCRNWEDIAFDLGYSTVYLYKLHREALNLIEVPKDYSKA
jgi:hypothetical protein